MVLSRNYMTFLLELLYPIKKGANRDNSWQLFRTQGLEQKACRVRDQDDPGPGLARPWRMLGRLNQSDTACMLSDIYLTLA